MSIGDGDGYKEADFYWNSLVGLNMMEHKKGKRPSADGSATEKVTQSTFAGDRVSLPEMNSALQAIAHGRNVFWALKANQEERNGPFKDLENSKLFLKRLVNMQKKLRFRLIQDKSKDKVN